jgi:hypothetical protein
VIDPLAGKRQALNRGEVEVLTWAELTKCPVSKDEVFPLRSCTIQIGHVQRRLIKGEQRWEARVIYHWPDRPRIPASQHGQSHPAQYVNSHHGAVDGIGEEVPTDAQRRMAEEGRLKTVLQGSVNRDVLRAHEALVKRREEGKGDTQAVLQWERAQRRQQEAA